MTLKIDGVDVMAIAEVAAVVGSIVAMLIIGLLVYLMVRPPRRRHEPLAAQPDTLEAEEMLRLIERMESRLEVLERAVSNETDRNDQFLEAGAQAPEGRRMT